MQKFFSAPAGEGKSLPTTRADAIARRLFFLLERRGKSFFFGLAIIFALKSLLCHTRFSESRFGETHVG